MTTNTDALKQALEALEWAEFLVESDERSCQEAKHSVDKAITAIREALAEQPAPVAEPHKQQEPVARFDKELNNVKWKDGLRNCDLADQQPLYTSPQSSKPWVGLSTDEIYDMYNEPRSDAEMVEFARAIEAKLKEKNA